MTTAEANGCSASLAPSAQLFPGGSEAGPSSRSDSGRHHCPYDECTKSYIKASKLAQHVRSHTGERPFECNHPGCDASYMRNEHLKAHQRRHQDPSEKPFACQEDGCNLKFWTSSQLKNHVQACHADHLSSITGTSTQDYPCTEPGCDLSFYKRKQLRQHLRDQHGGLTVPDQSIDPIGSHPEHPELSAAELPFACQHPGCGKRFPTNSKRKTHYRTHEDGRYTCSMHHESPQEAASPAQAPYIYTFSTWSALQLHMKETHPPICPWPGCSKQFQRQDNLRAHYRRHEQRKLRLEIEAKVLEGSLENELNHLRAESSDDSYASSSDEEEESTSPERHGDKSVSKAGGANGINLHAYGLTPSAHPSDELQLSSIRQTSRSTTPTQSPSITEEQLVHKAAKLHTTRPRRGGVFRDLSSSALSVVTSLSGRTGSALLGSVATSVTSGRDSCNAFACTWNGCSKVFTRKSTLSIHVRTAHLGERPFECSDCGRRFAHKHLVSRHRRVCTGIRSSPEQTPNAGSRLRFSTSTNHSPGNESFIGPSESENDTDDGTDSDASAQAALNDESDSNGVTATVHAWQQATFTLKPRLLDLLTGQGYSAAQNASAKRKVHEEEGSSVKKRRTTRNRIFSCPWTKIRKELDQQLPDPALRSSSEEDEPQNQEHNDEGTACEHRFKRLYDLRRHLRAQHGLDLTPDELSAITRHTAWTRVQ
ncbi:hypothetical protein NDA13_002346 [Ustilago tritici]|nr:hypothetical protein NDA13_002346 [Ustilago tritici]